LLTPALNILNKILPYTKSAISAVWLIQELSQVKGLSFETLCPGKELWKPAKKGQGQSLEQNILTDSSPGASKQGSIAESRSLLHPARCSRTLSQNKGWCQ